MPLELWNDKRTPPEVRRAANLVLEEWQRRHGENLRALTASGLGTAFESPHFIILGRANDARKTDASTTALFWNSVTRKSFMSLRDRATREKKKLSLLLITYRPPHIISFEVPSESVPWESLPPRRDGGANLTIHQTQSGPALKTTEGLLDLTPWQLRIDSPATPRATPEELLARVTIEPGKRSGKPCIRGLRITVDDVLEYLASGMSEIEILEDFPDLELDDIRASLAFAARRERMLRSA
jgi:uncharacterized protein (DUF433 family)